MFKFVIITTLIATSTVANAASTWNFEYSGFYNDNTRLFDENYKLKGYFTGTDVDKNGVLSKAEITAFVLNGTDYIACASTSNQNFLCGIDRFTYSIGGSLDFYAGIAGSDPEGAVQAGHYFDAGNRERNYRFTPTSTADVSHLWTTETRFQIAAVPEPQTWVMLLAGLALANSAMRRRSGSA